MKKKKRIISYIGSKFNLYNFLNETILKNHKNNQEYYFHDLFAGTSSVSELIKEKTSWNILVNDFLEYSYILSYILEMDNLTINEFNNIKEKLNYLNEIKDNDNLIENNDLNIFNEFSINGKPKTIDEEKIETLFSNQPYKHSRMFFPEHIGKHLDLFKIIIKKWFNNSEINEKEKNILLIFLLNYTNKHSNTTSVYSAYLKRTYKLKRSYDFLDLELLNNLEINQNHSMNITHLNLNILDAIEKINKTNKEKNIIYLDPPYSTRSYERNYHILNFVINLNFNPIEDIKLNSKTGQQRIYPKNPFRSKKETFFIFEDMIEKSLEKANNIYISYSTDGIVKQENIDNIFLKLQEKYPNLYLYTHMKDYKRYKSSNNDQNIDDSNQKKDLFEIIWHFQIK